MIQAQNGQIPDKQYYHDPNLKNKQNHTVCYYLWINNIQIPKQWQDKQYNHPIRNDFGYTNAMNQANQQQIPSFENYHNPEIQDPFHETVAISLASQGIIPPKQWHHNPNIRCFNGMTVAMLLASRKVIPPMEWVHNPELSDRSGWTVSMQLALNGIIPPPIWHHRSEIQNFYGLTVSVLLSQNGVIPPVEWNFIEDFQERKSLNLQIEKNLQKFNFIKENKSFIFNVQSENLEDFCQVCLISSQQNFIKMKCKHKICFQCFQEIIKQNKYYLCPVCRKLDCIVPIDEEVYQIYLQNFSLQEIE